MPDPDNVPGHIVNGQLLVIVNVEDTVKGKSKNTRKIERLVRLNSSLFNIIGPFFWALGKERGGEGCSVRGSNLSYAHHDVKQIIEVRFWEMKHPTKEILRSRLLCYIY